MVAEGLSDLSFGLLSMSEGSNCLPDHLYFFGGTRDENYTIRLDALMLATRQEFFLRAVHGYQLSPQAISGWATPAISQLYQTALPSKRFYR
jgi:hypothetical protein